MEEEQSKVAWVVQDIEYHTSSFFSWTTGAEVCSWSWQCAGMKRSINTIADKAAEEEEEGGLIEPFLDSPDLLPHVSLRSAWTRHKVGSGSFLV